jgi:hypothetical protein
MNSLHSVLHRKLSPIRGTFAVSDLNLQTRRLRSALFEYDCSESNNGAVNIPAGARRAEREVLWSQPATALSLGVYLPGLEVNAYAC